MQVLANKYWIAVRTSSNLTAVKNNTSTEVRHTMSCVMSPEGFETLLEPGALRTVFQPIARRRRAVWEVAALECLTRGPGGTPYEEAPRLFAAARTAGREAELDRACVRTALETAATAGLKDGLFINVLPVTLASDPAFPAFFAAMAAQYDIPTERLTVEVTEHDRSALEAGLVDGVRALEAFGVRVALDDFGLGPADYRALRVWRPRWLKLDDLLFREARRRKGAWDLVQSAVADALRWGVDVIAEGLERPGDMWMAAELGIDLLQGNFICAPLSADRAARAHQFLCGEATA